MTIPVVPSGSVTVEVEPTFATKGGGTVAGTAGVTAFVTAIKTAFSNATSFVQYDFWSQPSPDDDPIFIYNAALGIVGTNGTANTSLSQAVYTYRTVGGGLYRLYLLESVGTLNTVTVPPYGSFSATIDTYVRGGTSFIVGRDGSYLSSPVRRLFKTNDALRKKFLLFE